MARFAFSGSVRLPLAGSDGLSQLSRCLAGGPWTIAGEPRDDGAETVVGVAGTFEGKSLDEAMGRARAALTGCLPEGIPVRVESEGEVGA